MPTLTETNARLHDALDAQAGAMLERLTALEIEALVRDWSTFRASLEAHAALEEAEVLPRYSALGPFERGASPQLVHADHLILKKTLRAGDDALEKLREAAVEQPDRLRSVMVTLLAPFLRLRGVLEHHTEREQRFVYPALDRALPATERRVLVAALAALENAET